jgi:hypothetical protein
LPAASAHIIRAEYTELLKLNQASGKNHGNRWLKDTQAINKHDKVKKLR